MDADATVELLREILAGVPRLTGAACIGHHELFDPVPGNGHRYRDQERARLTKAARVCAGCPVQSKCASVTVTVTVEVVIPTPRGVAGPPGSTTGADSTGGPAKPECAGQQVTT